MASTLTQTARPAVPPPPPPARRVPPPPPPLDPGARAQDPIVAFAPAPRMDWGPESRLALLRPLRRLRRRQEAGDGPSPA